MRAFILLSITVGALVACADDANDSDSGELRGRGSAACKDAQDAICDFASDRCRAIDRASCDANYQGIECRSDEAASACANAVNDAACGQLIVACEIATLADPEPAILHCEHLVAAICDHAAQCGAMPSDCEPGAGIDCSSALAIDLRYEACLEAVAMLTCSEPIPTICEEVVRVGTPMSGGAS
jgi:hypothetical protein